MGRGGRLFLSLYIGFFVYCMGVLFFGRTGIAATQELSAYQSRLERNLASLEGMNSRLVGEFESLRSNPDTIKAEAHQLGYYADNEKAIQVDGYDKPGDLYAVGTLVNSQVGFGISDGLFRIVGVGAALASYLLCGLFMQRKNAYQSG